MTNEGVNPDVKRVLVAMMFGAKEPLTLSDIRRVFKKVAAEGTEEIRALAQLKDAEIRAALDELQREFGEKPIGIHIAETSNGFRFETDAACGPWMRELLDLGKPARLSRAAIETLAIIAYRQPIPRAEIEAVRGVSVDAIMRSLLEMQLVCIVGRSELPGRPLLYGTTQSFLEHFGIKSVKDLPGIDQLARRDEEFTRRHQAEVEAAAAEGRQQELPLPPTPGVRPTAVEAPSDSAGVPGFKENDKSDDKDADADKKELDGDGDEDEEKDENGDEDENEEDEDDDEDDEDEDEDNDEDDEDDDEDDDDDEDEEDEDDEDEDENEDEDEDDGDGGVEEADKGVEADGDDEDKTNSKRGRKTKQAPGG